MKKLLYLIIIFVIPFTSKSQSFKFCSTTYSSKYVLTFNQDDNHSATFKLYDSDNNLIKGNTGIWELRDEGVYGPVTYIIYKFTGANSHLPDMKFLFIRDGNGSPQEIRDSQERTWGRCF
jgi:hypothetical protein